MRDFVLGLLSGDGDWPATRSADLRRVDLDVLLEDDVRNALMRLNPEIAEEPSRADEVLYRLRGITLSARSTGLVPANEEFRAWLSGEKAMPYGPEHQHVPVALIDFDNLSRNTYRVATEVTFRHVGLPAYCGACVRWRCIVTHGQFRRG
ncbi:MAG TPA: type I restriction endonuclease [Glaciihabitans sp.]|nr:type I restriction endonuclease [Glaciihabitans sp.]